MGGASDGSLSGEAMGHQWPTKLCLYCAAIFTQLLEVHCGGLRVPGQPWGPLLLMADRRPGTSTSWL